MKAKIAPKPEIVLLYQQEKIKNGDKLPEILEQMGIRWKAVTQQELCFTTGELAEYRRKEDGERQELQQIPQIPAMAMGGIAGKQMCIRDRGSGWSFQCLFFSDRDNPCSAKAGSMEYSQH